MNMIERTTTKNQHANGYDFISTVDCISKTKTIKAIDWQTYLTSNL